MADILASIEKKTINAIYFYFNSKSEDDNNETIRIIAHKFQNTFESISHTTRLLNSWLRFPPPNFDAYRACIIVSLIFKMIYCVDCSEFGVIFVTNSHWVGYNVRQNENLILFGAHKQQNVTQTQRSEIDFFRCFVSGGSIRFVLSMYTSIWSADFHKFIFIYRLKWLFSSTKKMDNNADWDKACL